MNPNSDDQRVFPVSPRLRGDLFSVLLFRFYIHALDPKTVAGAAYEDIFQRRLADRDGFNLSGECLDNFRSEAMTSSPF